MQFVCTSILAVIIRVIDCAQPLTVIMMKLQPFGSTQAVIDRIYLQCTLDRIITYFFQTVRLIELYAK